MVTRHWSEIPSYEWQDSTWGVEVCTECGLYEGEIIMEDGHGLLCEKCYAAWLAQDELED